MWAAGVLRLGFGGYKDIDTRRFMVDFWRIVIAILLPPLGVFLQVGLGKHF